MVEEYFDAHGDEDWSPRYNIAPTQPVPVVHQHPHEPRRVFSLMRWRLIPNWAKDMSGSAGMINARSETAAMKPAFRDPMRFRRCLVPADGFYEWRKTGSGCRSPRLLSRDQLNLRLCISASGLPNIMNNEGSVDPFVSSFDYLCEAGRTSWLTLKKATTDCL